ncbi:MAG: hypothetical protein NUV78_03375 [Candidatus Zambryskibacteria bacterium]|nr:hypothetical protein [Candidatus Zambryskibacteria bacterium]
MSLPDLFNRIKPNPTTETIEFDEAGEVIRFPLFRKLFLSLIIILVATLSFGLGRLSSSQRGEGVRLEYNPQLTTDPSTSLGASNQQSANALNAIKTIENSTSVVASKNGTKYHYPHCSSAKRILDANKIVFASPQAAEASGYTLAANCRPK